MSDTSSEDLQAYLEQLAKLLGESVSIPDLESLFQLEDAGGVVQLSADDLETILVLEMQREELARQEAKEQDRVAGQWDIVGALKTRSDEIPALPPAAELEILPPELAQDATARIRTAQAVFEELNALRGEADDLFEPATTASIEAFDRRDAAIGGLSGAIAAEIARRHAAIEDVRSRLGGQKATMMPEVVRLLPAVKPPTLKALSVLLSRIDAAVAEAVGSTTTGLAEVFAQKIGAFDELLKELPGAIKNSSASGSAQRTKDRAGEAGQYPQRHVSPVDLVLITGDATVQRYSDARAEHVAQVAAIAADTKKTPAQQASPEAWTLLKEAAATSLVALDKVCDAVQLAVRDEKARRKGALDRLTGSIAAIAAPAQVYSTDEQKAYEAAEALAANALAAVKIRLDEKPPAEFDIKVTAVEASIQKLAAASQAASDAALARDKAFATLTAKIRADAGKVVARIRQASSPLPDFLTELEAAYKASALSMTRLFDKKNAKNDAKTEADFGAIGEQVERLLETAGLVTDPYFGPVQANVTLTPIVANIIAETKAGSFVRAQEHVRDLVRTIGSISGAYRQVSDMQPRVNAVAAHAYGLPADRLKIAGYPAFLASLDSYASSTAILNEYAKFIVAFMAVEKAKAAAEAAALSAQQVAEYNASKICKFIADYDGGTFSKTAMDAKFVALMADVSRGPLASAYQASDDRPDKFSVENTVLVENRRGLVAHAHCDALGAPLPSATACHVKYEKYKYDPIYINFPALHRATLFHPANANLAKAQADIAVFRVT